MVVPAGVGGSEPMVTGRVISAIVTGPGNNPGCDPAGDSAGRTKKYTLEAMTARRRTTEIIVTGFMFFPAGEGEAAAGMPDAWPAGTAGGNTGADVPGVTGEPQFSQNFNPSDKAAPQVMQNFCPIDTPHIFLIKKVFLRVL
jgi:hypothetical protein